MIGLMSYLWRPRGVPGDFGTSREPPYIWGMTSVLTVANRVLQVAQDRGLPPLTPLQLMKLTYMCNGWMLGIHGIAMFGDKIEAWKYGPVIPVLYHKTKEYGSSVINEMLPAPPGDKLDQRAEAIIQAVVENYGKLSGNALSTLTHRKGSPWFQVWDGSQHKTISENVIRAHYEKLRDSDTVEAA